MISGYSQKWKFLIFPSSFLRTQIILFPFLFCIGDIMKDKNSKSNWAWTQGRQIMRRTSLCVVLLSAPIMPPLVSLSNNSEEYLLIISSLDISWLTRVLGQDKWESKPVCVVAVLKSRNMNKVYLVERKGDGNTSSSDSGN